MHASCLDNFQPKVFKSDSYIRRLLSNPVFVKGTKGLLSAFPIYYLSRGRHNYCTTLLKVAFPYFRSFVENDIFNNLNTENSSISFLTNLIFANLKSRDLSNYEFVSVATTELVIGLLIKYYNCKKIQKNNGESGGEKIKQSPLKNFFYKVLPLVLADSIIALFRASEVDFFNKNTSLEIKNDIKFKFLSSVISSSIFAFLNKEDHNAQCFFAKSFFLVSKFHDNKGSSKFKLLLLLLEPLFLWLEPKVIQSEFFETNDNDYSETFDYCDENNQNKMPDRKNTKGKRKVAFKDEHPKGYDDQEDYNDQEDD